MDLEKRETEKMIEYDLMVESVKEGMMNPCQDNVMYQLDSAIDLVSMLGTY